LTKPSVGNEIQDEGLFLDPHVSFHFAPSFASDFGERSFEGQIVVSESDFHVVSFAFPEGQTALPSFFSPSSFSFSDILRDSFPIVSPIPHEPPNPVRRFVAWGVSVFDPYPDVESDIGDDGKRDNDDSECFEKTFSLSLFPKFVGFPSAVFFFHFHETFLFPDNYGSPPRLFQPSNVFSCKKRRFQFSVFFSENYENVFTQRLKRCKPIVKLGAERCKKDNGLASEM
jgi:hypothetical protein